MVGNALPEASDFYPSVLKIFLDFLDRIGSVMDNRSDESAMKNTQPNFVLNANSRGQVSRAGKRAITIFDELVKSRKIGQIRRLRK
jgi:hypothetical protein